jgi:hypothetical protein
MILRRLLPILCLLVPTSGAAGTPDLPASLVVVQEGAFLGLEFTAPDGRQVGIFVLAFTGVGTETIGAGSLETLSLAICPQNNLCRVERRPLTASEFSFDSRGIASLVAPTSIGLLSITWEHGLPPSPPRSSGGFSCKTTMPNSTILSMTFHAEDPGWFWVVRPSGSIDGSPFSAKCASILLSDALIATYPSLA